jgi:hyperosmotically inducible periplasmic protein
MYTKSRNWLLAAGIALTLGTSGAIAADTMSQDITEARQETQIWTAYALSPYLRANDLKVSVHGGKATLSGTVEEGVNKDLAKQIAMGVNGVKEVENNIVVKSDYTPPSKPTTRSFGETVDDATITASVKSKLLWSKYADGLTTDVDTKNGKVTLTGTADSAIEKELAKNLALNTKGVISVDNRLVINTNKAAAASNAKVAEGHAVADSWITTKVKSTYGYSSNVDGSDISVNTANGIVTLSGQVDSGAERELAIELAKNIKGVKNVQSKGLTLAGG